MEPSALNSSLFDMRQYSVDYGKRNIYSNLVTNTLAYNPYCLQEVLKESMVAQNLWV